MPGTKLSPESIPFDQSSSSAPRTSPQPWTKPISAACPGRGNIGNQATGVRSAIPFPSKEEQWLLWESALFSLDW